MRRARLVLLVTLAFVVSALAASSGHAVSTTLVINEVDYDQASTDTAEFLELKNVSTSAIDLDPYVVRLVNGNGGTVYDTIDLPNVSLAAGDFYVVCANAGTVANCDLDDAPDTNFIQNGDPDAIGLLNGSTLVDALSYRGDTVAPYTEGSGSGLTDSPVGANGLSRCPDGADTDVNNADFEYVVSSPGAANGCPSPPPIVSIHAIQGDEHLSPLDGTAVQATGVVTAVRGFGSARGFWMQDPAPDADVATSEGIFVFTGSTSPNVQPGDGLTVTGAVDEFYPDTAPANSVMLSTTELVGATWVKQSSGNTLPAAEVLAPATVPAMYTREPGGTIEVGDLQPSQFALDFFESREGMRVQVSDARVVGPTTAFNELFVTTKPNQNPTFRGGTLYGGYDQQNSGRLMVQSLIPFAQRPFPQVNVGDSLAGVTAGPVDYSRFGGYMVQATELGTRSAGVIQRETTRPQHDNELAVATYNVENLDPTDPADKFARLALGIVTNLESPDVVALEEIQDNNGAVNDGTVAADQTLDLFTAAIVAAGGPQYEWRQIDPVNLADGGEPGGNIRVGFLFNPARVTFVDRPGGDATTAVEVVAGPNRKPRLSVSPGRIDPASSAWTDSRKPLVGEFVFNDKTIFVVANHFNSKGGDQPLFGRFQPPTRSSEVQRLAQATEVREFVGAIQTFDRDADIVVLGDINDFEFSPTVDKLTEGGALVALMKTLPVDERYSYVFQGNSQTLDQILVGGRMKTIEYDVVHINAEFFDQASDHDPQVVRIKPGN